MPTLTVSAFYEVNIKYPSIEGYFCMQKLCAEWCGRKFSPHHSNRSHYSFFVCPQPKEEVDERYADCVKLIVAQHANCMASEHRGASPFGLLLDQAMWRQAMVFAGVDVDVRMHDVVVSSNLDLA